MGLRALLGVALPIRFTGALLLRKRLEASLAGHPRFPDAFYDEFLGEVIAVEELSGLRGLALKTRIAERLEFDAAILAETLRGHRPHYVTDDSLFVRLPRKHGML